MITIEKLNEFGANTDEALGRCYGNSELYLRLVQSLTNDNNLDKLKQAIAENDLESAFLAAHALKGSLGNLSITPLYNMTSEITELLRGRVQTDYKPYLEKIVEKYDELIKLCD